MLALSEARAGRWYLLLSDYCLDTDSVTDLEVQFFR